MLWLGFHLTSTATLLTVLHTKLSAGSMSSCSTISSITVIVCLYLLTFYRVACNAVHGIAVAILSFRPSVCLSDACIVTKRIF